MDKVHTRSFEQRIVIGMNELGQPITENDKVLSELSSFLGTLAKRCVPLTYVTWRKVPKNLKETMWNYVKVIIVEYINIFLFFLLVMHNSKQYELGTSIS